MKANYVVYALLNIDNSPFYIGMVLLIDLMGILLNLEKYFINIWKKLELKYQNLDWD